MKKILFAIMTIALVTTMVFAEEEVEEQISAIDESAVTVEGDATLIWGYDLGTESHGFDNQLSFEILIPIIAEQTMSSGGGESSYAEIKVEDIKFNFLYDDEAIKIETDGSWDAKLVFNEFYLTVYNRPDFSVNYAQIFAPIKNDDYDDWSLMYDPGFGKRYGTKFGFANEDLDIGIKIASEDKMYRGVTTSNKYAFGADVTFSGVENLTIEGSANYATWADGILALGVKAEYAEEDGFEATLGFDGGKRGDADFLWDASLSAGYKFVTGGIYYASAHAPFGSMYFDENAFKFKFVNDMGAFIKVTDGDAIENLEAWATFAAYKFFAKADVLPMAFGLGASYNLELNETNNLKPFFSLYSNNYYDSTEAKKFGLALEVGAEFGLFENATITAKYEAGRTLDNLHNIFFSSPVVEDIKDDKGYFSIAVKVEF